MVNNHLDTLVKNLLADFEVPLDPHAWEVMETQLEAEIPDELDSMAKSQLDAFESDRLGLASNWVLMEGLLDETFSQTAFDDAVKQNLETIEPTFLPQDWAAMQTFLESETIAPIDETAAKVLQNIEVALPADAWLSMNEALDNAHFPHEIDLLAKNALQHLETPYQEQDWVLMEEKIKEKEKVRINVLFTKTIEILLMVFALWTAGNFLSPSKNQSPQYETPYEPIENKAVEPEKTEKNSTPLPPNVPIASSVLPAVNQLSNKNVLLQNEEQNKIEAETEWNNTPIFNLPKNKRENELLEEPTLTEVEVNSENFLRKKHFLMPITFATDINYLCEVETDKRKEERKIVDIIISPEYTNVADGVPQASNKQQVMGFSIGTAASLKLSEKFNFVLGILYNKKIYAVRQHYQFLASNQFSLNSLHDLKLHTLQLQPMIQYDAVENDKFRAYATAGVGANFVMHTEQIAQEFTLAAGINNLNTPDPAAAADTNFSKRGAVTDFGIIDGGNVQSNFFVTLNLGVGVEYQLNTDWSIFIQPTYQQALSPFSDRNDYFNTFALVIGAKVAL